MSKLSVELCAVIGHTGKDVVPEVKRLTSLALWKEEPDVAQFYAKWRGDADRPSEPLFAGPVSALKRTSVDYNPDSRAPWTWDLPTEVFEADHDGPISSRRCAIVVPIGTNLFRQSIRAS